MQTGQIESHRNSQWSLPVTSHNLASASCWQQPVDLKKKLSWRPLNGHRNPPLEWPNCVATVKTKITPSHGWDEPRVAKWQASANRSKSQGATTNLLRPCDLPAATAASVLGRLGRWPLSPTLPCSTYWTAGGSFGPNLHDLDRRLLEENGWSSPPDILYYKKYFT